MRRRCRGNLRHPARCAGNRRITEETAVEATLSTQALLLLLLAAGFAGVNGANDGGAIVSGSLKVATVPPWAGLVLLSGAVAIVPVLVGTAVAETILADLLDYPPETLPGLAAAAVVAAVLVVAVLTHAGLPTSLTLAFVGAVAGAAAGLSQAVPWAAIGRVLAIGLIAPLTGLVLGWAAMRAAALLPRSGPVRTRAARLHVAGFALQCVAYGANDGQKMVAVLVLAAGASGLGAAGVSGVGAAAAGVEVPVWGAVLLALCFLVGAAIGLPRAAGTLTDDVLDSRPPQAVAAELAASAAVFGSAALGAPVSMTQAIAGSLVGTGLSDSYRKVRWKVVAELALAWVLTLPAAFAVAAGAAFAGGAVLAGGRVLW